ncbi:MAG: hypothetical protein Fur0022_03470 [Anaerolineales bacterium]
MAFQKLNLTQAIEAPLQAVYRAFTTPNGWMDWLAHSSDVEPRVGGRLYVWDEKGNYAIGKYTALEENQRVAFDLLAPTPGHIEVKLAFSGNITSLSLEHSPLETPEPYQQTENYWKQALDRLKTVLETGLDPRLYSRPMLGVLISGMVDKASRERLQHPLEYGILLGGTLPGMGAEAVGMREGDVLVALNGFAIQGYQAIGEVIGSLQAGDSVHAVWYRGKERHEADLALSGRPHPHIPVTLAELAEEARQIYASLDGELAEILNGVPETRAEYRPAETEWNIKEILAHLISTERAMQIWLINAIEGTSFNHWAASNHHIVKSLVDVYSTLPELLTELRRAEGQTVALLQRLPEDLVTHKGTFHNIVTTLNKEGLSVHTRLHFDTIKRLLEEAQK